MVGAYWTLDASAGAERKTFLQKWASHQLNLAPLICRVVRAVRVRGRWAWIPGWGLPLRSRLSPPTSDSKSLKFITFYKHVEI